MAAGFVDLHHHAVPAAYREALRSAGATDVGSITLPDWDADSMMRQLDELGIARAVLSVSTPATIPLEPASAAATARQCNDELAALRAGAPDRLGAFALLPLPNVAASVAELEYALDDLRLDGVSLLTNYGGCYLGHPAFETVLAALDSRSTLVHIHPNLPPSPVGLTLPDPVLEFAFDTTRAIADMIARGTLERYRDIRFVLSHLGGALPFLAPRLAMIDSPLARTHLGGPRADVAEHLRRLYYDVALSTSPENLRLAIDLLGAERLVFGSDVPFAPPPTLRSALEVMDRAQGLSPRERELVERGTAEALLRH